MKYNLSVGQIQCVRLVMLGVVLGISVAGQAEMVQSQAAPFTFNSAQQEAQYRGLIDEFRCPKCQNQNLAGSDAPIAQDLKQKTYELVKEGQTDQQIRDYMVARYGDFISYKPPLRPSTWILWIVPPLLLVSLLIGWVVWVRRREPRLLQEPELTSLEQARLQRILTEHSNQPLPPKDQ